MKIGVISDTHIPEAAGELPKVIRERFKEMGMILHAGDLLDLSLLEELKSICRDVRAVSGNMDRQEVKEKLPRKEIIKIGKFTIGLMHGWGNPKNLMDLANSVFKNDGVDVIIFGHSHSPLNEKHGNILYFNPGSPTDKIFAPCNSFGIIEITDKIEAKIIKI